MTEDKWTTSSFSTSFKLLYFNAYNCFPAVLNKNCCFWTECWAVIQSRGLIAIHNLLGLLLKKSAECCIYTAGNQSSLFTSLYKVSCLPPSLLTASSPLQKSIPPHQFSDGNISGKNGTTELTNIICEVQWTYLLLLLKTRLFYGHVRLHFYLHGHACVWACRQWGWVLVSFKVHFTLRNILKCRKYEMNRKLAAAKMNQDNLMLLVFLVHLYSQKLLSTVKNGIAKILLMNSLATEKMYQVMTPFPRSVAFHATKMLTKNSVMNAESTLPIQSSSTNSNQVRKHPEVSHVLRPWLYVQIPWRRKSKREHQSFQP